MIASPQDYLQAAQRVVDAENRLRNQAQQLFDVANEMRKRQADESLPFEERFWATIAIEEANELAKDHLDLVDWLLKRKRAAPKCSASIWRTISATGNGTSFVTCSSTTA